MDAALGLPEASNHNRPAKRRKLLAVSPTIQRSDHLENEISPRQLDHHRYESNDDTGDGGIVEDVLKFGCHSSSIATPSASDRADSGLLEVVKAGPGKSSPQSERCFGMVRSSI